MWAWQPGAALGVAALAEGMLGGVASQLVGVHIGRLLQLLLVPALCMYGYQQALYISVTRRTREAV